MTPRPKRFLILDSMVALLCCLAWYIAFPAMIMRPDIIMACLGAFWVLGMITGKSRGNSASLSLYSFQAVLLPIPNTRKPMKPDGFDWLFNTRAPFLAAIIIGAISLAIIVDTGNEGTVEYPVIQGAYVIVSKNSRDGFRFTDSRAGNQRLLLLNLVAAVKEGIREKGKKQQVADKAASDAREAALAKDAAERWSWGEFWTALTRRIRYRGREPIYLANIYLYTYTHMITYTGFNPVAENAKPIIVRNINEETIAGTKDMELGLASLPAGNLSNYPRSLFFFAREFSRDLNLKNYFDENTVIGSELSGTPLKDLQPMVPPVLIWLGPDTFEDAGDARILGDEYRKFMNGFFGKKIMIVLKGFYVKPEKAELSPGHENILTRGLDCEPYYLPQEDFGKYDRNFSWNKDSWKTPEGKKFLDGVDRCANEVKRSISTFKDPGDDAISTLSITERILDEASVFWGIIVPLAIGLALASARYLRFVPWRIG